MITRHGSRMPCHHLLTNVCLFIFKAFTKLCVLFLNCFCIVCSSLFSQSLNSTKCPANIIRSSIWTTIGICIRTSSPLTQQCPASIWRSRLAICSCGSGNCTFHSRYATSGTAACSRRTPMTTIKIPLSAHCSKQTLTY